MKKAPHTRFYIEALTFYLNVQAAQLTYFVGSHVWVEDPDEAWLDGEILESKDNEITVSFESGTKVRIYVLGPMLSPVSMFVSVFRSLCCWIKIYNVYYRL